MRPETSSAASRPFGSCVVTAEADYELVLTPPARRALTDRLPENVAAAVIDFITTGLLREPLRLGTPLRDDLRGIWSARRGTYQILYRLRETPRELIVLRIEHRRDVYRRRDARGLLRHESSR